jgi:hypothetical protein
MGALARSLTALSDGAGMGQTHGTTVQLTSGDGGLSFDAPRPFAVDDPRCRPGPALSPKFNALFWPECRFRKTATGSADFIQCVKRICGAAR